ncbi:MAG: ammonia-forming cytochrome c nitrite reductase subunit c552 [Desulfuromonas sp.]|nr:ammonia-forming cytochrome c nitrite reductase subunit c552 [Desulfuromonas sp.]
MANKTKLVVVIGVICLCTLAGRWVFSFEQRKVAVRQSIVEQLAEANPELWQEQYPQEYASWKKTIEPTPVGKSRYKKGFDADGTIYSRLNEFPYLALLLNGSGYGLEFSEPRGHGYMIHDQLEIEPVRLKSGGTCLSCKTPYAQQLQQELGAEYFSGSFEDVRAAIPEPDKMRGVGCSDCHHSRDDVQLEVKREFTLGKALAALGFSTEQRDNQAMRSLVCAQCHVSYNIAKDENKVPVDVSFPWQDSKWGAIRVENIISHIRNHPELNEWTQAVTGFKLGFIRHPEFELFSNDSLHWQQGATCADCHMPADENGVSDHRVMSPLKNDLVACAQCHAEEPEQLRAQVYAIQDEVAALMINTGQVTATVAKLFEITHQAQANGKVVPEQLYAAAKENYIEAFYRLMFIQSENSMGFHNPAEALRVLHDGLAAAQKAETLLRRALAEAGVVVAVTIDLHLEKYLQDRGTKRLPHLPEMEVKVPSQN